MAQKDAMIKSTGGDPPGDDLREFFIVLNRALKMITAYLDRVIARRPPTK